MSRWVMPAWSGAVMARRSLVLGLTFTRIWRKRRVSTGTGPTQTQSAPSLVCFAAMIFKSAQFLILAALCALCTASSQQGSNLEGSQIARRVAARHLLATSKQSSASQKTTQNATVIVVGAGVAGLAAAKRLSDQVTHPQSKPVTWVVSKIR